MTALQEEVLAQPNVRRLPARRLSESAGAPLGRKGAPSRKSSAIRAGDVKSRPAQIRESGGASGGRPIPRR